LKKFTRLISNWDPDVAGDYSRASSDKNVLSPEFSIVEDSTELYKS
jgi:hypothetical protein